jgi:hypothetical protein
VTEPRPVLDYVPRLVDANRRYRVTAPVDLAKQSVWWLGGVVLDQGQEGSCVGHGVVAEWLASPVRGNLGNYTTLGAQIEGHRRAVDLYNRAKEVDEFEGVNYDGTSVRAGLLVGRERGWYSGFNWAFNLTELRAALQTGPVVIGIDVLASMYDTQPNGDWAPSGPPVGGHCCLVTGYSPAYSGRGPRYRIRNSWGQGWGSNGNAYIAPADLDRILFAAGGEAAIPTGRHQ